MKLKWKVSEAPTGLYRSFQKRAWPMAFAGDDPYANIVCERSYTPDRARGNNLYGAKLKVYVRVPSAPFSDSWKWAKLREEFDLLSEAKEAAQSFFDRHPEYQPKGE